MENAAIAARIKGMEGTGVLTHDYLGAWPAQREGIGKILDAAETGLASIADLACDEVHPAIMRSFHDVRHTAKCYVGCVLDMGTVEDVENQVDEALDVLNDRIAFQKRKLDETLRYMTELKRKGEA